MEKSDQERIEDAFKHLSSLLWDDYTNRLFRMAAFSCGRRTKYITEHDAQYIREGLDHIGARNQPWESREEFTLRFLDRLVARGEADLLLSAAVAASRRGVRCTDKAPSMANVSYTQWVEIENQKWRTRNAM